MERKLYLSLGTAFVGGLVLTYIAIQCWDYIAAYTPVIHWLLNLGLRGNALRLAVFPIDFLTNVAFSLPLALVLLKLQPPKLALFLTVAIIPSFVWLNLPLVDNEVFYQLWPSFVPGWLHSLFALPVAAWLMSRIVKPDMPNNAMHTTCEDARA